MIEILVVFAILGTVAFAAVMYSPASPFEHWQRLSVSYASPESPPDVDFQDQLIRFGKMKGDLAPLNNEARFGLTLDDDGLWIVLNRVEGQQLVRTLKIPGQNLRFHLQSGNEFLFDVFAQPPVRIAVSGMGGRAIYDRLKPEDSTSDA